MDLATLIALYPVARELIEKGPEVRRWIERKAGRDDPNLLLQLQLLQVTSEIKATASEIKAATSEIKMGIGDIKESMGEIKTGINDVKEGIFELRGYTLTTALMSAMLSNPNLTDAQIKENFIRSAELARDIITTIRKITP